MIVFECSLWEINRVRRGPDGGTFIMDSVPLFWHINSSQCKEKGSKWFEIQNRQAVLIRPKLQSAPGTNKERHFLETFYSPIQFWKRLKSRKSSQPSTNWLVSAAIWAAQGQTRNHLQVFILLAMFPSSRDWKSISVTWFVHVAQRQSKLYIPTVQFCKSLFSPNTFITEIAEPSQKLGSYQGMTGSDFAVHLGVPLNRPSPL